MLKVIFAKNIIGNDRELFEFVSKRFDVLVASIPGTQAHNIKKIVEWTHEVHTKLYVRSQFVHVTPLDMIVEKAETMLAGGVDGLVFQGQTTEDKALELMSVFQAIAQELSGRNVAVPIVFMVDVEFVSSLSKLTFPENLDVRTAVRVASKNINSEIKFPAADLVIVDFSPLDNQEQYDVVDKAALKNSLNVIAYMTYDIMSDELKKAIQKGYKIPSKEIGEKQSVTTLHDLTLRTAPSGQIIKRGDGKPLVVNAGLQCVVMSVERKGPDTWYQVETVFGISGWIAGVIGSITYAA